MEICIFCLPRTSGFDECIVMKRGWFIVKGKVVLSKKVPSMV